MRHLRRNAPTVNAGSMADIAFLLLIFFLVTTTISADKGILRKLPADCAEPPCNVTINDRNIFKIFVNRNNEIMIEDKDIIELSELKETLIRFIDNNGDNSCNYCNGERLATSSNKPSEAVISLKHDALTNYNAYIKVQDEISKAYLELRTTYAKNTFNKTPETLTKDELKQVKEAYPFILSEVEVERN
ncbi:biopolymer transport protein ExbD [Winogradskyella wandonensis]|uniref:Biopolymer transport protein ExbD n=1 Tax=Winogradskyella wandonensis TaxID=1442586 RepID=A0A4R1KYT4_9FLAO|nr:biopolymer transporter ExbD [Winogradskyella wandonensis]TCK69279.1 biopolymer transport protein ExbD [Winogradskyella wandonensis]